ncbi:hypothetical protein ACQJBY_066988 [Aegilops geniculata]
MYARMDKYTMCMLALLACSATIAQCGTMAKTHSEKINLPAGLCKRFSPCTTAVICFCCLVDEHCYTALDECKTACKKSSSSEDIQVATTSLPPLPSPFPS